MIAVAGRLPSSEAIVMAPNAPEPIEIRTKVVGVSFSNRHGALKSRQTIIRKFCRDGEPLQIRVEPDNPYSKNAMSVWVQAPGLIVSGAWYQVGYLPQED